MASSIVPPAKRAQAISMLFAGLTLANVLGVPFGTALGQALGWRATFWAVVATFLHDRRKRHGATTRAARPPVNTAPASAAAE